MERYTIAGISSQGRDKPVRNKSVSWGEFWSDSVAHLRNTEHKRPSLTSAQCN